MSQDTLHREIIALSESHEWEDAKEEWRLYNIWFSDDPKTCLCGHYPITEICVLLNEENGNTTEVGNHCVKNFLGINSERVFASVRKVVQGIDESLNEPAIELAYEQGYISREDRKFYLSIWRKRELSPKQAKWKRDINRRVLSRMRRK